MGVGSETRTDMARILIVDDDPSTLDVIEFTFIVDGHETLTAQNGEEAGGGSSRTSSCSTR